MSTIPDKTKQLQRLLKHLDAKEASAEILTQRKATRKAVRTELTIINLALSHQPRTLIYTRNISTGGIGFLSTHAMKIDDYAMVILPVAGGRQKLLLARIVFTRYVGGGWFEIGASFEEAREDPDGRALVPDAWHLRRRRPGRG